MGTCEAAPDEYCGYFLEPKEGEADHDWHIRIRNAVCLRIPKYDGLCVWHADTDAKTAEEMVESRLMPDDVPWETNSVKEHLGGAILRGVEFPDRFSFSGCVLVFAKFPDADLRYAEFADAYLLEAEFPDAKLQYAEFHDADLRHAEFRSSYLQYAEFPDTNLRNAEFPSSYLQHAEFPDAELYEAKFSHATLQHAEFPDAELYGAKFPHTNLQHAEFPHANLQHAEFPDSYLQHAEFPHANLQHAEFSDAILYRAEFPDARLYRADFSDTYLKYAEFPDAKLQYAEFSDAKLQYAEFPHAVLQDAEFPHAVLQDAEFPHADLRGAKFPDTNLQRTYFAEANLQEAEFSDADLRGAAFRPACVRVVESKESTPDPLGASLEDAQFEDGTDLRGADLSGTRLYQTAFRDVRINDETQFGIEDGRYGEKCRYEYDPNTGVCIKEDMPRLRAAVWTYRRLESLFKENAMDRRARNAHIRKQEAQRKHQSVGAFDLTDDLWIKSLGQYFVSTLNWSLHRHGESLRQLLKVSAYFIIICGVLYVSPWSGVARNNPETTDVITYQITTVAELISLEGITTLLNGLYFSIITFSTIGYSDFYPASPVSRLLVGFESLAGALLIALFVFVIGRRVAR